MHILKIFLPLLLILPTNTQAHEWTQDASGFWKNNTTIQKLLDLPHISRTNDKNLGIAINCRHPIKDSMFGKGYSYSAQTRNDVLYCYNKEQEKTQYTLHRCTTDNYANTPHTAFCREIYTYAATVYKPNQSIYGLGYCITYNTPLKMVDSDMLSALHLTSNKRNIYLTPPVFQAKCTDNGWELVEPNKAKQFMANMGDLTISDQLNSIEGHYITTQSEHFDIDCKTGTWNSDARNGLGACGDPNAKQDNTQRSKQKATNTKQNNTQRSKETATNNATKDELNQSTDIF